MPPTYNVLDKFDVTLYESIFVPGIVPEHRRIISIHSERILPG
jgi:hypothetical protein